MKYLNYGYFLLTYLTYTVNIFCNRLLLILIFVYRNIFGMTYNSEAVNYKLIMSYLCTNNEFYVFCKINKVIHYKPFYF